MQRGPYVSLLFFFLQREISSVSRPIAATLCHMIGNGCNFNKKAVLPQGNRAMPQLFFSV